jgi:excisionase family DNA binding protein
VAPDLVGSLRILAEALPVGTVVPVPRELLLQLLSGNLGRHNDVEVDLTVAELAVLFSRKRSAVRSWLERGDFPQAYKLHGREWRVPASSVHAFQEKQRQRKAEKRVTRSLGLASWRQPNQ